MDVNLISNWVLIRLSGFLSYFLFTCSIGAGLMSRFSLFQKQKASYDRIASIKRMGRIVSGDFSHDIIMERSFCCIPTFRDIRPVFLQSCPDTIGDWGPCPFIYFCW